MSIFESKHDLFPLSYTRLIRHEKVHSNEVRQFELPSPPSLDPSSQLGFVLPPTGEHLVPPIPSIPKRSDPSRWSIANTTQYHHSGGAVERSPDCVLLNPASNSTYETGRPSFSHGSDSRSSLDHGQLIPMSSSRQSSISGQTGSSPSFWTSEMPVMSGDNHSLMPEGLTSTDGGYGSFPESAYFPSMSPAARQLPQPASGRGLGIRDSFSSCYSQPRADESLGYNSDNCDVGRVLSETSPSSVTSNSYGPASTCSSSPKDSRDSSTYGYGSISHSASELTSQQLSGYSSTGVVTAMSPTSPFSRPTGDQDQRRRNPLINPHYDYYSHQALDQRMNGQISESSGTDRVLPRYNHPQSRYQVPLPPLTGERT